MLSVECHIRHATSRGESATYRHSRQPHVPAAMAYARQVYQQTAHMRHGVTVEATLRDDAGRILHAWTWRRV
jgi:hypothetical protein